MLNVHFFYAQLYKGAVMKTVNNQWERTVYGKPNIIHKPKEKASVMTQGLLMGKWPEIFSNKATYYS